MKTIYAVALVCLLGAAIAAPVTAANAAVAPIRDDSECESCEALVASVEAYLSNVDTQKAVTQFIDAALCSSLPDYLQEPCQEEVSSLYAQLVGMVTTTLTPEVVCTGYGLCGPPSALSASVGTPFQCPLCRLVVSNLVKRLENPKIRAQIHDNLLKACGALDAVAEAKCVADVSLLFASLDALSKDLDPSRACEFAKFCPPAPVPPPGEQGLAALLAMPIAGADAGLEPLPERVAALGGLVAALAKGPRALTAARASFTGFSTPVPASRNDAVCDECKVVVTQVATILADPKTQQEIIELAKDGCVAFPTLKDQCETYVTLYGPLALSMVLSYLQPDGICSSIGYCPGGPSDFATL